MTKGKMIKLFIQQGASNEEILTRVVTTLNSIRWYRSKMNNPKSKKTLVPTPNMTGLQNKILAVVDDCWEPFREKFGELPEIKFDLTGAAAGQVVYTRHRFLLGETSSLKALFLRFNLQLANNQLKDFLARTVPHELAHVLANLRHSINGRKIKSHGREWRKACKDLGMLSTLITRCHSYKQQASSRKPIIVKCNQCGYENFTSRAKAKRMEIEIYTHSKCDGRVLPIG